MSILDIALALAGEGLPVFPCNEKKRPCCENGFYDAATDPAQIAELWRRRPGPLIGVPTGPVTGMDLLDIDPRHGGDEWIEEHVPYVGDTLTIETRSGGTHFIYKHREGMRNTESKIAPGVDTRGVGGYVIWWAALGGVVRRRLPIADWPDWLAQIAMRPTTKTGPEDRVEGAVLALPFPRQKKEEKRTPEEIALDMIADQVRAVENASAGNLHYTLRSASRTIGGLFEQLSLSITDAGQTLYEAAQRGGAIDKENAWKTISSGLKLGRAEPLIVGKRR